jgi:hypothetical protein
VAIKDWIDIPALQSQSRHATAVIGVLFSLFIITHLAKFLFGEGILVIYLVYIDDFLTWVVVLLYGLAWVYHILKEGWKGHANFVLVA